MRNFTGAQTTNDLTVAVIHTYYVVVNGQPVLVHNTDPDHIMGDWGWPGEANSVGSPYIWHADRADTDNDKQDWIPMSSWVRNGAGLKAGGRYAYVVMEDWTSPRV